MTRRLLPALVVVAAGLSFRSSLEPRQNADGSRELRGMIDARPGAEQVSLKQIR